MSPRSPSTTASWKAGKQDPCSGPSSSILESIVKTPDVAQFADAAVEKDFRTHFTQRGKYSTASSRTAHDLRQTHMTACLKAADHCP